MPPVNTFEDGPSHNVGLSSRSLIDLLRWRWKAVLLPALAAGLVATVYLATRAPTYTTQTLLLVYNARLGMGAAADAVFPELHVDPMFLETQMEILKSEKVALNVVDRLGLAAKAGNAREEFSLGTLRRQISSGVKNAIRSILQSLGLVASAESIERVGAGEKITDQRRAALKQYRKSLSVERVGLSYVVSVKYTSLDPEMAARVANETARAYIEDQEAARFEAAQSASAFIRDRVRDVGPRTRVIAQASPPTDKSNQSALLILLGTIFAGLGLGSASVFARELLDRRISTPAQAAAAIAAECFGIFPNSRSLKFWRQGGTAHGARCVHDGDPLLAHVLDKPLSTSWQTLSLAAVAMQTGGLRTLGVTAILPNEGTTTVAANLARLIASGGRRVLLVDADHQHSALSRSFCGGECPGLIELIEDDGSDLTTLVRSDERSGMHFLPLGGKPQERYRHGQVIWSHAMDPVLGRISQIYEYVIFDLPPLTTAADARAAAKHLQSFLLVVRWAETTPEQIQSEIAASGPFGSKLLGTVLTRVNGSAVKRFARQRGALHEVAPITYPLPESPRRRPVTEAAPGEHAETPVVARELHPRSGKSRRHSA